MTDINNLLTALTHLVQSQQQLTQALGWQQPLSKVACQNLLSLMLKGKTSYIVPKVPKCQNAKTDKNAKKWQNCPKMPKMLSQNVKKVKNSKPLKYQNC
nr:3325_t:CDS:2 [Entrophospora candida]